MCSLKRYAKCRSGSVRNPPAEELFCAERRPYVEARPLMWLDEDHCNGSVFCAAGMCAAVAAFHKSSLRDAKLRLSASKYGEVMAEALLCGQ